MTGNTPSITTQPVFRPKTSREVHMEDISAAQVALFDKLDQRGIKFATLDDENRFWDSLSLFLEESFGWPDYASHN